VRGTLKVFQVYSEQKSRFGGERAMLDATTRVLAQNGHDPRLVMAAGQGCNKHTFKIVD
jgi:hypothetical protein